MCVDLMVSGTDLCINTLAPHNNLWSRHNGSPPFYGWGYWGTERRAATCLSHAAALIEQNFKYKEFSLNHYAKLPLKGLLKHYFKWFDYDTMFKEQN